ncbi:hypothetical protein CsSME_00018633 [Camellia sinensis var. sinensis]
MKNQKQKKQKQKQNQNPSWQDLNPFILSKIFSFLSPHDQLFGPPYVCHSWLSSTLHTIFKNSILDLRLIDTLDQENQRLRFTHLLKLALNHYHGWVSIQFPSKHKFGYFGTVYIAENTPNITSVALSSEASVNMAPIFISLLYWQKLKIFEARMSPDVGYLVISQLVDWCKNMTEIRLHGSVLMEREVSCLVDGLSGLKILDLCESTLSCSAIGIVLDGRLKCVKEINLLHCKFVDDKGEDARADYLVFKAFRDEVVEKASGIKSLKKFVHCLKGTCLHCKDKASGNK